MINGLSLTSGSRRKVFIVCEKIVHWYSILSIKSKFLELEYTAGDVENIRYKRECQQPALLTDRSKGATIIQK